MTSAMVCSKKKTLGSMADLTCALSDGTPATQINRVVSHPTLPLLVTAHEDKYIRIFDITTGSGSLFVV